MESWQVVTVRLAADCTVLDNALAENEVPLGHEAAQLVQLAGRLAERLATVCTAIGQAHRERLDKDELAVFREGVQHLGAAAAALEQVPPALDPAWTRRPVQAVDGLKPWETDLTRVKPWRAQDPQGLQE